MQSNSSRIWTRIAVAIPYNNNQEYLPALSAIVIFVTELATLVQILYKAIFEKTLGHSLFSSAMIK